MKFASKFQFNISLKYVLVIDHKRTFKLYTNCYL